MKKIICRTQKSVRLDFLLDIGKEYQRNQISVEFPSTVKGLF
jgi:hypothetical protein